MHFTHQEMKAHEATRDKRPTLQIDTTAQFIATSGYVSLLSYFPHDAQKWAQVNCGDCWVWGCTAVASISNGVQGYPGPFSVQYLNSNFVRPGGSRWACCGGWADDFVSFYNGSKFFIPWSNQNASFQDQLGVCGGATAQNGSGISTTPNDPFTGITLFRVPTYAFWTSRASAISAIKSVLNQKRAIAFTFFLGQSGWNAFTTWWNSAGENAVWGDFDYYRGQDAGHLVALVGFDDSDSSWILKNSWGTTPGRPNGTFKIPQSLAYAPFNLFLGFW